MNIVLTGGTGFIGQAVIRALTEKGYTVHILSRAKHDDVPPRIYYHVWNLPLQGPPREVLEQADAVINLAGEPIVGKRWNKEQKIRLAESRCDATHWLVGTMQKLTRKPKVLINASAIGFYPFSETETMDENTAAGKNFLAQVCKAWEAHAIRAEDFGIRVVRLRIGLVLGKDGGVLGKMLLPFKLGLGGPLGNGRQWMSWIHAQDIVNLILFALENENVKGALNATAPQPVTNRDFSKSLAKALHRPCLFPAPAFMLKLILGEMSSLLLQGQKVLPAKAQAAGFKFAYPELEKALQSLF